MSYRRSPEISLALDEVQVTEIEDNATTKGTIDAQ